MKTKKVVKTIFVIGLVSLVKIIIISIIISCIMLIMYGFDDEVPVWFSNTLGIFMAVGFIIIAIFGIWAYFDEIKESIVRALKN